MKKFAFIFPGQGSQHIGMLSEISTNYPFIVEKCFCTASEILGYDLWKLTQQGPIKELNKTWQTQPALLTSSVAIWKLWNYLGGRIPSILAGHSLGEYSALVCAGVISFTDAVKLVEIRGKLMQEVSPEGIGTMTAIIGIDDILIKKICRKFAKNQIVSPANFNSPGNVVIAGHKEAVERVSIACKIAGAKRIVPLSVSVPSHCMLMKPAAKRLELELKKIKFNKPTILVLNNFNIKCETTPESIRNALVNQLYHPVYWTKTIEFMSLHSIKYLYEVGPGKVLTNLTKRITNTLVVHPINKTNEILSALYQQN